MPEKQPHRAAARARTTLATSAARPPAWYDRQYNNRARVADAPAILQRWAVESERARDESVCMLDVPYGGGEGETLDLFLPSPRLVRAAGHPARAPVLMHIHGGYWRALDKRDQSFIAPPFAAEGALVVVPNYALAPKVSIEHITLQIVRAVEWTWRHAAGYGGNPRRIVVAGHSAGGHLAAMMLACRWREVAGDLPEGLVHAALSISGVFELEPLRHAPFLAPDLRLSAESARRLSPALLPAPPRGPLYALAGGEESAEFLRQNKSIRRAWGGAVVPVCEPVPGRNHMDVLFDLADPASRVHALTLELLGLR